MRGLTLVLAIAAVALHGAASCCLPNLFSTNFDMRMDAFVIHPMARARVNATMNGVVYVNSEADSMYFGGDGTLKVSAEDQVIPIPVQMSVALDRGRFVWVSMSIRVPGRGTIRKCNYLRVLGGIPPGYGCFNNHVQIEDDADGHDRYKVEVKPSLEDIVTVDDQCMPILEKAKIAVAENGVSMTADISASFTNREVGVTKSLPPSRPRYCSYKGEITIPPPTEEGKMKLMQEDLKVFQTRRKRAVDATKETLSRIARDAMDDFVSEFLP